MLHKTVGWCGDTSKALASAGSIQGGDQENPGARVATDRVAGRSYYLEERR